MGLFGKGNDYVKEDGNGSIRVSKAEKGWEVTVVCYGKTLKYGASSDQRTFWSSRKDAVEVAEELFGRGIQKVYLEERKRQFGM